MTQIVVVETPSVPGFGIFQGLFEGSRESIISRSERIPDSLEPYSIVVLNCTTDPTVDQQSAMRLREYVASGGACITIHDSNSPISVPPELLDLMGLQLATDGFQVGEGGRVALFLVSGDPTRPMRSFPVTPVEKQPGHPILSGIGRFDLSDECWAMNVTSDVTPLLYAECGDRLIVDSARLQEPLGNRSEVGRRGGAGVYLPLREARRVRSWILGT